MKLVRDKIPELINARGENPITRVSRPTINDLLAKLDEEVTELRYAPTIEEVADVIEVSLAIGKRLGFEHEEIEAVRHGKFVARGGFYYGTWLEEAA